MISTLSMTPLALPEKIHCERVTLARYESPQAAALFNAAETDRTRIGKFMPWVRRAETLDQTVEYLEFLCEKWDEKSSFEFGILESVSSKLIGGIGMPRIDWPNERCEVGYWISSSHEGKGLVSEALRCLENCLFELGFNRIEITCSLDNPRSENVPKANGYTCEGTLRKWFRVGNEYQNMRLYSKIRDDLTE